MRKIRKTRKLLELMPSGKENALLSAYFCDQLRITRQKLSEIVEDLRREGIPICAVTGNHQENPPGYYFAANLQELNEFILQQIRRGTEVIRTGEGMTDLCPELYSGENAVLTALERKVKILSRYDESDGWEVLRELGTIEKSESGKTQRLVRLMKWTPDGVPKVDIRVWYQRKDGELTPGKGISLDPDEVDALMKICEDYRAG